MALKRNKPTTPSKRHLVQIVRSDLLKVKPIRSKTLGLNKKGGRNHHGKITSFHRGGGHKRRFRLIDFRRLSSEAEVLGYEYDPNRSSWIVRAYDKNTQKDFYIIAPKGLLKGMYENLEKMGDDLKNISCNSRFFTSSLRTCRTSESLYGLIESNLFILR